MLAAKQFRTALAAALAALLLTALAGTMAFSDVAYADSASKASASASSASASKASAPASSASASKASASAKSSGSVAAGKSETLTEADEYIVMYRMYNPYTGEHLYTANKSERNNLVPLGWHYEGVGWMAPKAKGDDVYRLYNPYSGDHHYTMSSKERDDLVKIGWRSEGVGWKSCPASDKQRKPLYRQFNPNEEVGTHNYTLSKSENDNLVKLGWRAEGIGWYGHEADKNFKDDMEPWTAHVSGDSELDTKLDMIVASHPTLRSCFNYVVSFPYREGARYYSNPHVLPDSTTISLAKDFILRGSGNCYRFASAFCWLARDLGYDAKVISGWVPSYSAGRAPHGWVEIKIDGKTYVFDPDLAHEHPGRDWYMFTYANAPTTYGSW